jgi:hypothetical protein
VIIAYVVGFFVMLWVVGWEPHAPHKKIIDENTPELHISPHSEQLPSGH